MSIVKSRAISAALIFTMISTIIGGYSFYRYFMDIDHVIYPAKSYQLPTLLEDNGAFAQLDGKKILLINTQKKFGGGEVYTLRDRKSVV